jgi:pimeloyl-ACP methyl ester carboxylesterase
LEHGKGLTVKMNRFERTGMVAHCEAKSRLIVLTAALVVIGLLATSRGVESTLSSGEKTSWHGFDRYDFTMDETNLSITPSKAADDERDGIKHTVTGQRRCVLVVPKSAASGNPWSWRGCYWDHQPQSEIELLKRGFHVAYIEASATLRPDKHWEAWYAFLTEKQGLSSKPAFVGMSRGGEFAFTWATAHPDKVSCIYADNPGSNPEVFRGLGDMAIKDVPLLLVCGSIDPVLGRNALAIESIYQQFGGRVSIMIKEGAGHHPHSLRDPKPIVDFVLKSVQPAKDSSPPFPTAKFTRNSYYGVQNSYRNFPSEDTYITCRGPEFSECYDRYTFNLADVEGPITVVLPKAEMPGKPWVFRSDFVDRDALVDLALLAKGFHIVTGPVPFNADGPKRADWDAVYRHLVAYGFSTKTVLAGAGEAAGEAYAWAIDNPDKVACIYGENPVLRCNRSGPPLLNNLAPLAKAGVPILHVCGSLDPWLSSQTRAAEKRYKELGGQIFVMVKEGESHYPLAPKDPQPVIEFITRSVLGEARDLSSKSAPAVLSASGELRAGTAKVNITPDNPTQPVHDPVYARSLVLEINGERLGFVSVDLGIYTSEHLIATSKERFGISDLLLSSSHTHSDPGKKYSAFYEEQILKALDAAVKNLFPAKISAGHRTFPQLGFNRLIVREDGHARESWFSDDHYRSENPDRIPFGPVDPEVGVIRIDDLQGQPRAILMNYACHADVVCQNYAISADYPGVAARKVEEAFDTNVNCLFVQGAGGNIESLIISSRRTGPDDPFQTDYSTIDRVGGLLAFETVKLAKTLSPKSGDKTTLKRMNDSLKFGGRFDKNASFDIHISSILINDDIVIATVPGEPFVQLQLEWKKKLESTHPFLFGYTWYEGTWPNYIPDIKSAALGGYGADQNGPKMIEVGSGETIMNKHLENIYRLSGLMRQEPGPVGFAPGPRWLITPVPRDVRPAQKD